MSELFAKHAVNYQLNSPQNLRGLSEQEALERLKKNGPNVLRVASKHWVRQFLSRFANPLVMILLFASAISASTGDFVGSGLIWMMVLLSVILDFVQQYRAEDAAEKLKDSVLVNTTVIREGTLREIPLREVVAGDLVSLSAGDLIPADAVVLEAKDLFVNQSLLTGESYPVEKRFLEQPNASSEIVDATNAVFMGTSVVSGTGLILICETGEKTFLGEIADTLKQQAPQSDFDKGIHDFGILVMRLTVLLVLFVLLANTVFHRPLLESFLFAMALAVGLTPELLPMIVTVTLSRGAVRMAKHQVIVKRLSSIQNLGSMTILCSDKTGTLTEGKIHLEKHVDLSGRDNEQVLMLGYLNSYFETGLKSPIDQAILEHEHIDLSQWQKIDEVPFDFERRRVSILVDNGQQRWLVVKGAVEELLAIAKNYNLQSLDEEHDLSEDIREKFTNLRNSLEQEGYRTLGIAWKRVERTHPHALVGDESELTFAGIAAFQDPPKPDAKDVVKSIGEAGVNLKLITGDSELVSRHLLQSIDMPVTAVLTGSDIQKMDDMALAASVEDVNLFCRVSPIQKNRIILALKRRGHSVGYLGDGINDAPSLHSADVGISVQGAVDVAKEAADVILLKNDLSVLTEGIYEGRRTHSNIMKYIMMGTSSNFGNMFSMAGATIFLPFLPMLPLQVLLNNFLYDLSEVTIPMDDVDAAVLTRPSRWNIGFIHKFMWVIGLISSLFDALTFFILITVFHANEALFHTGWFVESIATQVLVIFIIRTRLKPWQSRPSRALFMSSLVVVALAAYLPFSPVAQNLGFVPLQGAFFAILLILVIVYLGVVELMKQWFYRYFAKAPESLFWQREKAL